GSVDDLAVEQGDPAQHVDGAGELVIVRRADDRRVDRALLGGLVLVGLVLVSGLILVGFVLVDALVLVRLRRLVVLLVGGAGGLVVLGLVVLRGALDLGGFDDDVGIDAAGLDRAAGRGVVARGRQPHPPVPRDPDAR